MRKRKQGTRGKIMGLTQESVRVRTKAKETIDKIGEGKMRKAVRQGRAWDENKKAAKRR